MKLADVTMECISACVVIFFFKEKTADERERGLVGSEKCISDSATVNDRCLQCHLHRAMIETHSMCELGKGG